MPLRVGQEVQALPRAHRLIRSILGAVLSLAALPGAAQEGGGQVTLSARSGGFEVTGELLSHDGAWWRLLTDYGVLTLDAAAVACAGEGCPPPELQTLSVSGDAEIGRALLPPLIEGFARSRELEVSVERPDRALEVWTLTAADGAALRVSVRYTSTAEGFADMTAELADLVLALRPPDAVEELLIADSGLGDLDRAGRARVLGTDELLPVVAPGSAMTSLTVPELAALYSGEIADWGELGLPPGPVRLHLPAPASPAAEAFGRLVMDPSGSPLAGTITRHAAGGDVARAVAADPGAIGLVRLGEAGAARALVLLDPCGEPGPGGARPQDGPLAMPVLVYLPARPLPPLARGLAAFFVAPDAEDAIRDAGLHTRRAPDRIPLAAQGLRLARAIDGAGEDVPLEALQDLSRAIEGRDRLTTTFRFDDGTARLDAASWDEVVRLARRIVGGAHDGRTLLLAGFTDAQGPGGRNRRLSGERAETVRRALTGAIEAMGGAPYGPAILAAGFGEAAPLACGDTPWAGRDNRRVEVWTD